MFWWWWYRVVKMVLGTGGLCDPLVGPGGVWRPGVPGAYLLPHFQIFLVGVAEESLARMSSHFLACPGLSWPVLGILA